MKPFSLMTGLCFDRPVFEVVRMFERCGVSHAEIWGHPDHADLTDSKTIRRLADFQWNNGIDFVAVHPPGSRDWDISSSDTKLRNSAVDRICTIADHLPELGIHRIVLHAGGRRPHDQNERESALNYAAESLDQILEHLTNRPQTICLENTLPHHLGGRLQELKWLDEHTERDLSFTLDFSHARLSPDSIADYIDEFRYRIIHTHISDNLGQTDDHYPPGKGSIDIPPLLTKLSREAFLDYWNMEILASPGSEDPEEIINQSLAGLKSSLHKVSNR